MRKAILASLVAASLVFGAQAAQASCGVGCLRGKVASLKHQLGSVKSELGTLQGQLTSVQTEANATQKTVSTMSTCLVEIPVTQYGDPSGTSGYVYNTGTTTFNTTALDATTPGDPVSAWVLVDHCNTTTTAPARARSASAARQFGKSAIAPEAFLHSVARF